MQNKQRINIRLPQDLQEQLDEVCQKEGITASHFVRTLLENHFAVAAQNQADANGAYLVINTLRSSVAPLLEELLVQAIIQRKLSAAFMLNPTSIPLETLQTNLKKFRIQAQEEIQKIIESFMAKEPD